MLGVVRERKGEEKCWGGIEIEERTTGGKGRGQVSRVNQGSFLKKNRCTANA